MEKVIEKKPVAIKENSIAILKVVRLSSFGAFLDAGTGDSSDDILLHNAQQTEPVKVGDSVKVFIYHDPHHRLTASMRLPQLEIGEIGYVKVLLTTRFGAFVDVGTERGIFLPISETIGHIRKDQMIWVKLYVDKTGRLAVTMHVEDEIQALAKPAHGIKVGGKIEGTIYNITKDGAFIITREKWLAFLHRSEMPKDLMIGQEVTARVTFVRKDGRLNVSLRQQKEKAMESDMDKIVAYMEQRGGSMLFTDKSDPDQIRLVFGLSKAAFKRAIGHLLKEGKIELKDDMTVLKK